MVDFQSINAACLVQSTALLARWLPDGKRQGEEWVALNPTRPDSGRGSFKVNVNTGLWGDFSTGDKGGDFVSLYAYLHGLSQLESAKQLEVHLGMRTGVVSIQSARAVASPREEKPQPITPPIPCPDSIKHRHGEPSAVYEYKQDDGSTLGFVCRFDKDGRKDVKPLFYFEVGGWQWRGFTGQALRPIYGLDKLAHTPSAPVLVVEGEKCGDVSVAGWVVVSWLGGTSTAAKVDWSPLKGRSVKIWPDNDEVGHKAAHEIKKLVPQAVILNTPTDKPKAWDIADATPEEIAQVLRPPTPVEEKKSSLVDNRYYKALGYKKNKEDRNEFYFWSRRSKNIIRLRVTELRKENLQEIAPLEFWAQLMEGATGAALWDGARDALTGAIFEKVGVYHSDLLRGRGVWVDSGDIVFHAGDILVKNGQRYNLRDFDSRYVYEISTPIDINGAAASAADGMKLIELCQRFSWENPMSAFLLAGWMFLAPVCGALPWRPHIALSGLSGSGKSWILASVIAPLLEGFSLNVSGVVTEAGLRQHIGSDALPVIFDEAEKDPNNNPTRLDNILRLMRAASSASQNSRMVKFNQSTIVRSMFCLASIIPIASEVADKSRISVLGLRENKTSQTVDPYFAETERLFLETYTHEYLLGIRIRSLELMPTTLQAIKLFRTRAAATIGAQRGADQIGTLLAGFWMLHNDEIPTETDIEELLTADDWAEEKSMSQYLDHVQCLEYLMQATIKVNDIQRGTVEVSFSELIYKAQDPLRGDVVAMELARYGLKVESGFLYVQHSHAKLAVIFKGTPWDRGWTKAMKYLKGAHSSKGTVYFGREFGSKRCLVIPLECVI